jgi:PEP-CTERM motif
MKLAGAAALLGGLCVTGTARADWTFNSCCSVTDGGVSVTASGYYFVNGSGDIGAASGAAWTAHSLQSYSGGLGMDSDGNIAPNHAIDNNGNTEAVLLQFGSSVVLSSVNFGYVSGDSDFSLFRYVGTGTPPVGSVSLTSFVADATNTANNGWDLVGNYSGPSAPATVNVNNSDLGSSWWLISAYNTAFGTVSGMAMGNDYFKLLALGGSKCTTGGPGCGTPNTGGSAPEPGTLALVAAALFAGWGVRRKGGATRRLATPTA